MMMIDSDPPKLIFTAMWMVASNPSILSLHVSIEVKTF